MPKKRRLPFWLGLVLAVVLAALILMLSLVPQPEQGIQPARVPLPAKHVAVNKQSKATAPKTIEKVIEEESSALSLTLTEPPTGIKPSVRHGLALILDDVGYNIAALERVLALSVPVAVAVLPDAPHAEKAAKLAHRAGQVVMLHLPMQPEDPSLQMSDAFLLESMSESALRDTFLRDMAKVPYVEGVNNHMGSKLTQLEGPMRQVMQQCEQKGLFFVDSKTSSNSVAANVAASMGIRWAARQIFLDHIMTPEAMDAAWQHARACVSKGRRCIIIAHPRAASVAFLESHLTKEDAAEMVSIKQLLRGSPKHTQSSQQGVTFTSSQ